MSVHTKLMEARIKLQNSELKKTGENKFAGYKYFELGDFLPTVQKIFAELKLCGVVSFAPDIATLTITDTDDGSTMAITSPMSSAALKGCHEVQNLGAVQTYIRRYLWVAAMEIVEHDALDATTGKDSPAKQAPSMTSEQIYTQLNNAAKRGTDALNKAIKGTKQEYLALLTQEQKTSLRQAATMQDEELAGQA
jgi:hypothetical protein